MRWFVLIIPFLLHCTEPAEERSQPLTFSEVRSMAAKSTTWRVFVCDDDQNLRYSITDAKVIHNLASLIHSDGEFTPTNVKVALSPHIYVDFVLASYVLATDEDSPLSVEVTGDEFYLHDLNERYGATLKTEELYNRLADQDFLFPGDE